MCATSSMTRASFHRLAIAAATSPARSSRAVPRARPGVIVGAPMSRGARIVLKRAAVAIARGTRQSHEERHQQHADPEPQRRCDPREAIADEGQSPVVAPPPASPLLGVDPLLSRQLRRDGVHDPQGAVRRQRLRAGQLRLEQAPRLLRVPALPVRRRQRPSRRHSKPSAVTRMSGSNTCRAGLFSRCSPRGDAGRSRSPKSSTQPASTAHRAARDKRRHPAARSATPSSTRGCDVTWATPNRSRPPWVATPATSTKGMKPHQNRVSQVGVCRSRRSARPTATMPPTLPTAARTFVW